MPTTSSKRLAAALAVRVVESRGVTPQGGGASDAPPPLEALFDAVEEGLRGETVSVVEASAVIVFSTADEALADGLHLVRTADSLWRASGFRVCGGIHAGEVTAEEDGASGPPLEIAARVTDRAEPGQIVLTALAYQLLASHETAQLVDLGEHELTPGEEPIRLYSAREAVAGDDESMRELLQEALFPLQLLEQEDEGGMGEIHLARDPALQRTMAVKVLRSELSRDADQRARFFREARLIAGLSHPNVVSVYTVSELSDGTPFFVMDYVEGGSYADRLGTTGPLSVREARKVVGEVAAALEAAHRRGVVHRDIKPSNVLFDPTSGRALVTDWGIAGLDTSADASPDTRLTQAGEIIGSPRYMSPEQLAGDRTGPASDVYALGLLAFELLTGAGPFVENTPRSLMVAHLREEPPALSSVRSDVDPELDSLVGRCLAKSPDERPTAKDVRDRLAPGADSTLEWPPPGLARLRGRLFHLAGLATAAVLGSLEPLLDATLSENTGVVPPPSASLTGRSLLLAFAAVATVLAAFELLRIARIFLVSLRNGYRWSTLIETAADMRGDTGALIVGVREYVGLDDAERKSLRKNRVRSALLLTSAPLVAVVALGASIGAANAGWLTAGAFLTLGVGAPFGLALLGLSVRGREHRATTAMRAALKRHRAPSSRIRSLIDPWYATLDDKTGGAGGARKPRAHPALAALIGVASTVIMLSCATVGLAFGTLAVAGPRMIGADPPQFARTEALFRDAGRGRALLLRADPSVTDETAADWLFALTTAADRVGEDTVAAEMARGLGRSPIVWGGGRMGACSPAGCRGTPLVVDSLLPAAFAGLEPAEREYLRGVSRRVELPELGLLARAGRFDELAFVERVYGAEVLDRNFYDLPIPAYGPIRDFAQLAVGRAALLVAEGRLDEAEELLLELNSVGLTLADGAVTVLLVMIGTGVALDAQEQLRSFYAFTGRVSDAARLAPGGAEAEGEEDPVTGRGASQGPQDRDRSALESLRDPTVSRPVRWGRVPEVRLDAQCGSAPGLLFGMPDGLDAELRGPIRAALARTGRQRRVYDAIPRMEVDYAERYRGTGSPLFRMVWLAGGLIGSERMRFCASVFGSW